MEGGAIGGEETSHISITNGEFKSNRAGTIEQLKQANAYGSLGGSISSYGRLNAMNVSFIDGLATRGGEVALSGPNSQLTWIGGSASNSFKTEAKFNGRGATGLSYIIRNSIAPSYGGAAHIIDSQSCVFQDIQIHDKVVWHGGGGIYTDGSNLTASNLKLIENRARYGGGLVAGLNSDVTLNKCISSKNVATQSGGSLSIWENSHLYMANSTIEQSISGHVGGGIELVLFSSAEVRNSIISRCSAIRRQGGGISSTNGYLKLVNVQINNCVSNRAGGGIYSTGPKDFENLLIYECKAGVGAGLYSENYLNAKNLNVSSNFSTKKGGGIYIWQYGASSRANRTTIISGTLTLGDNEAYDRGGGLLIGGHAELQFETKDVIITGNVANAGGSGIFVDIYDTDVIDAIRYQGNDASNQTQPTVSDQVFVSRLKVGKKLYEDGVFDEMGIYAQSGVYKLEVLGYNKERFVQYGGALDKISVVPLDVFGHHIIQDSEEEPIVAQVKLKSATNTDIISGTTIISTVDKNTDTLVFDDLKIKTENSSIELVLEPLILLPENAQVNYTTVKYTVKSCNQDIFALVNIGDGKEECLPKLEISISIREFFGMMALCLILSSIRFGHFAETHKTITVYKIAGPKFTMFITIGCALQMASVASGAAVSNTGCVLGDVLDFYGMALVLIVMILKMYQYSRVFSGKAKNNTLREANLIRKLAIVMFFITVFVIMWLAFDAPSLGNKREVSTINDVRWVQTDACIERSGAFRIVGILLNGTLLIAASVMVHSIRNVPSSLNESREFALIIYQYFILNAILYPLAQLVKVDPSYPYALKMVRSLFPPTFTLFVFHLKRMLIQIEDPVRAGRILATIKVNLKSDANKRIPCYRKSVSGRRNYGRGSTKGATEVGSSRGYSVGL